MIHPVAAVYNAKKRKYDISWEVDKAFEVRINKKGFNEYLVGMNKHGKEYAWWSDDVDQVNLFTYLIKN